MSPNSQMTLFQSCKKLKPGANPIKKKQRYSRKMRIEKKRKNVLKDVISVCVLTFPIS
jgi:hypothetical protein